MVWNDLAVIQVYFLILRNDVYSSVFVEINNDDNIIMIDASDASSVYYAFFVLMNLVLLDFLRITRESSVVVFWLGQRERT